MTWLLQEKYKLPIYMPHEEEMTKEEFVAFCAANSHVRIERDENKQIFIMPPVFGETGRRHIQIAFELEFWNRQMKLGQTFDSSTGFELPDGSMKSPDAAWIRKERWDSLSPEKKNAFIPFAPDFVVEVLSTSDNLSEARKKMDKWIQNGTLLAWLIIPKDQQTYIYRADGTIDKINGFDKKISGEDILPNFTFDLSILL